MQMTDMEACSLGNGGNGGEAPQPAARLCQTRSACVCQVTIAGRGLRDFAKATDAGHLGVRFLRAPDCFA